MANDAGYIMSFDNTSGLTPQVVAALNNNFRVLMNRIQDPEIVMVSGINPPDPRTNETMFYKTDTGEIFIWAEETRGAVTEFNWVKVDLGFVRVEDNQIPASDEPSTWGERIWYNEQNDQFYILTKTLLSPNEPLLRYGWHSLESYVRTIARDEINNGGS